MDSEIFDKLFFRKGMEVKLPDDSVKEVLKIDFKERFFGVNIINDDVSWFHCSDITFAP